MIILDTDLLTLVQRVDSPEGLRLRARIAQAPSYESPAVTIITYEEQIRGWFAKIAHAKDTDRQIDVYVRLLQHIANYRRIRVLPFDRPAFDTYRSLRALKIRIGTMDLKIAAIALTTNARLISRNLRDFSKVPNLHVEDWTKP
jgi:tRNA(fMet)-specific endonuclease VapC